MIKEVNDMYDDMRAEANSGAQVAGHHSEYNDNADVHDDAYDGGDHDDDNEDREEFYSPPSKRYVYTLVLLHCCSAD
jgi:hypothetical protein